MVQESRGTNIIAVKTKIVNPKMIFDKIKEYSYNNLDPNKWYPMKQFTMLTDYIEKYLSGTVLKNIGSAIIPEMKNAGILPQLTPLDFLKALPQIYLEGSRGNNIGQWKLIKEEENHVIIENSTMHNCILEEGVIMGGLKAYGARYMKVTQSKCMKKGDNVCKFDIVWK
ncbi:MAG: hypothetical protein EAX96_20460 [Candidatus Lokiarchaeota archaeon]|nr:hypothetical protein [Candidatus Lokiarchaeota archaeon]